MAEGEVLEQGGEVVSIGDLTNLASTIVARYNPEPVSGDGYSTRTVEVGGHHLTETSNNTGWKRFEYTRAFVNLDSFEPITETVTWHDGSGSVDSVSVQDNQPSSRRQADLADSRDFAHIEKTLRQGFFPLPVASEPEAITNPEISHRRAKLATVVGLGLLALSLEIAGFITHSPEMVIGGFIVGAPGEILVHQQLNKQHGKQNTP